MEERWKYIIIEKLGHEVAILFDPLLEHAEVAQNVPVISAGFCMITVKKDDWQTDSVSIFGDSISLGKRPRPEDVKIILRNMLL